MISFSKVSKQYGRQILFVDASFQLNPGEKAGLVGPNGAGKTTVFRMITGEEHPDDGDVSVPKKLSIGYFRQDVEEMSGRSVLEEAIDGSGRLGALHHEVMDLEHALSDPERADAMVVEATVYWGEGVLAVRHLERGETLTLGESDDCDVLVAGLAEPIRVEHGEGGVHVLPGAATALSLDGPGRGPAPFSLRAGPRAAPRSLIHI